MKNSLAYKIVRILYRFIKFRLIPEKIFILHIYKKKFGKFPDLKNPKTFNEIMQWKKLYDRKEIYTIIADKYAVREYVANRIGKEYLIPIMGVYDDPNEINFNQLQNNTIIKPTHTSNRVIIIQQKKDVNFDEIKNSLSIWLKENLYYIGKEWQYKNIKPRIIIEKFLCTEKGEAPFDYKFHCYNGNVEMIQVDIGRFNNHRRNFYDINWKLLPLQLIYQNGNKITKPSKLLKMIELAENLSSCFDFIRVDFYFLENIIYFGELTLEPEAGFGKWIPEKYNLLLGKKLRENNEYKS